MSPAVAQGLARLLDDLIESGKVHMQKTELGPFVEPLTAHELKAVHEFHREASLFGWACIELRDRALHTVHLIAYQPQFPRA